jgi:hypothetical protein
MVKDENSKPVKKEFKKTENKKPVQKNTPKTSQKKEYSTPG